jgi:hypothetical protein
MTSEPAGRETRRTSPAPLPPPAVASRRRERPDRDERASGRCPWPLLAAALAAGLGYLAVELYLVGRPGFPLDDSWIHLQFARNLAAGQGLCYNPGEPVTGSTAPLWTALLALLFLLPGSVILWAELLGLALYVAGVDATWRLGRALGLGRGLAALAAGLTLATGPLLWSAVSGMEVPLFVLLSLWGMLLHVAERTEALAPAAEGRDGGARLPLALPVLALAVLARPEGALLLALAVVDRLLVARAARPPWRSLATGLVLALLVLAGPLLYYRWAGGSFLPTTFAVKGGGPPRLLPNLQYLYVVLGILFRDQPYMTLLAGAGAVRLAARLGTRRDRGLLPLLWVAGLPLAYSLVSPVGRGLIAGNFGRYYFPLLPPLALLGVAGLAPAAAALERIAGRIGPGARRPAAAIAAALLLWPTLGSALAGARRLAQNVANVEDSDVAVAHWLAPRLDARAVLAVNDIGALKYLLPNRVVDLVGIASPELRREVTRAARAGVPWGRAMLEAVERRRPDYVVIFPSWFPDLAADARFRPVHRLAVPDNVTMGGDEIVVYATPWTRYPLAEAAPAAAPGS